MDLLQIVTISIKDTLLDVLPISLTIAFFQVAAIRK